MIKAVQLATLVDEAPEGDEWLHEQKFDGYRIIAERAGKHVKLWSRRFKDWTDAFPAIVDAVAALPCEHAVIDGEVAAVLPDGRTSFQSLHAVGAELRYFAFDLIDLDGEDIGALPLEQRKTRLQQLVAGSELVMYSDHVIGHGGVFFQLACKRGLEGIVSKRRDKPYRPGRNTEWVKTKCIQRQELVIGGYTEPAGARTHIGALLVGYYEGTRLLYAGKVGTGFTHKMLAELKRQLAPLEQNECPFTPEPMRAWTGPSCHWVKPALVAEIQFFEWTEEGRLRHPSFQGLREDKRASEVVRERATDADR